MLVYIERMLLCMEDNIWYSSHTIHIVQQFARSANTTLGNHHQTTDTQSETIIKIWTFAWYIIMFIAWN